MALKYPTNAKMVLPSLERRNFFASSDNISEPLEQIASQMAPKLMKEVFTKISSK